ncbi:MAG: bifunctional aspartate kinase/homoserine dehydrogenase I [Legionellales bacterium]|nr:bifunctional aspartate kinase/homoserine dehydrogenase I [Legionellales bacterium]
MSSVESNRYIAHKFGGSSLANADGFRSVKNLLTGRDEIVVVSAVHKTTSTLQKTLDLAAQGEDYHPLLEQLTQTHQDIIEQLLPTNSKQSLLTKLTQDMGEIQSLLCAVKLVVSYPKEIQDRILGFGEQWSAQILTAFLAVDNEVVYLDAATVLTVKSHQEQIEIDWQDTEAALEKFLAQHSFKQLIVTGFIARTSNNRRTILGRNSSDFSGAIFARLFHANALYIWTDVDGIYSADPRKVPSAFPLPKLSYEEAFELAYFGAQVIHPLMIAPATEREIPIFIKNTFNPSAPGTCISSHPDASTHAVRAISSIDNIGFVNIEGTGLIGVSGTTARVFNALQQANISVILISQGSSEHSICFAIRQADTHNALQTLRKVFNWEIENKQIEGIYVNEDCAILAVVGDGMVGKPGIAGKLCHTLAQANINIHAIAQGSSERNISLVLHQNDMPRALRAVHSGFYLSHKSIAIALVGPGAIGKTLLHQINEALERLKNDRHANLCVRAIANSGKMLLSDKNIDLSQWQNEWEKNSIPTDLVALAKHLCDTSIPHNVIIDCSASQTVADHYATWIEQGLHIITPNKRANSGDIRYYRHLHELMAQKNCHYLYETTVCAGLPVINTLQDLVKTGDTIIKIEGVVSGTLSYIFNELATGRAFSDIVRTAKELNYTEPDPRDDLSGMDFARKMVCLAREIGMETSLNDIAVHDLVPPALKNLSISDFLEQLPQHDAAIGQMAQECHEKGERLAYVGTIVPGQPVMVSIQRCSDDHPFSRLQGTDNMLIFHTSRYQQQPLVIQGPGAGAQVTAAGVFADLLRLVSTLSH